MAENIEIKRSTASIARKPIGVALQGGGSWGAYYWNGMIYSSELDRGFDIYELTPSAQLSANEIAAAKLVTFEQYKPTKLEFLSQGTAIFHHGLTWHMSGHNRTNKVRWAMSSYRVSSRARYTGQANFNTDGLDLKPREVLDHPNFPIVFP